MGVSSKTLFHRQIGNVQMNRNAAETVYHFNSERGGTAAIVRLGRKKA